MYVSLCTGQIVTEDYAETFLPEFDAGSHGPLKSWRGVFRTRRTKLQQTSTLHHSLSSARQSSTSRRHVSQKVRSPQARFAGLLATQARRETQGKGKEVRLREDEAMW